MANRETQVDIHAIVGGSPKVRATQVSTHAVMMGVPHVRLTQCSIHVIQPTPNPVPPGKIMEMILP